MSKLQIEFHNGICYLLLSELDHRYNIYILPNDTEIYFSEFMKYEIVTKSGYWFPRTDAGTIKRIELVEKIIKELKDA